LLQRSKNSYKAKGWTKTNPAIPVYNAIEGTFNNVVLGVIVVIASFGVSTLKPSVIGATSQLVMLCAMSATVSGIRTIQILQSGIPGPLETLEKTQHSEDTLKKVTFFLHRFWIFVQKFEIIISTEVSENGH
jgi:ABC-type lipoprotein release transport system permease subunit